MTDSSLLLEAVGEVARHAGSVALRHFRSTLVVEHKSDGSPVTVADRDAERAARAWISRRFPGDGVAGEEFGADPGATARRWIIDPIDGTRSFVRGVPLWGTLVALCERDTVLAGAAFFPALEEIVVAAPGAGTWWNGARASVSTEGQLSRATALTTDDRFTAAPSRRPAWEGLRDSVAVSRTWGDCYGYLLVATGRAEIMVDPVLSDWDAAALFPIVIESGGVFTDWDGTATPFNGSAVATNAALAEAARLRLAPIHS